MKTLRVKMVGLLATALILFSAFRADKPVITIFMIGDSTMANKKIDGGNPERGWGMVLPGFFSEDIRIDNHAANGRSSKSFISEGRWEKVISKVKKGDYVFIQFGHNDEKADSTRHTDPGSTFDEILRRYVNETRAKGGKGTTERGNRFIRYAWCLSGCSPQCGKRTGSDFHRHEQNHP